MKCSKLFRHDLIFPQTQYHLSFARTNELLDKTFGYSERRIASHAPYVYSKDAWNEIYQHYGGLLNETLTHRYRQADDINSHHLHHYYIIHTTDQQHKTRTGHSPKLNWVSSFEQDVPAVDRSSLVVTAKKKLGYYRWPLWWTFFNVEFIKGGVGKKNRLAWSVLTGFCRLVRSFVAQNMEALSLVHQ